MFILSKLIIVRRECAELSSIGVIMWERREVGGKAEGRKDEKEEKHIDTNFLMRGGARGLRATAAARSSEREAKLLPG